MERREIGGKSVYIFEPHNVAFAAWAEIRAHHDSDLILISLDHHTDTANAFRKSDFVHDGRGRITEDIIEARIQGRISQVDWRDSSSVDKAVSELRNDEQIDAAIRVGLFSFAFCINHHDETRSIEVKQWLEDRGWQRPGMKCPEPPFTYEVPNNRAFEIRGTCDVLGCEKKPHNDDCYKYASENAIESAMLKRLIETANNMARFAGIEDITKIPYVLDIDLDYFKSIKSLSPDDASVFHGLIRNAVAITIATEPDYVHDLRLDDELTSEYALEQVYQHITQAMSV
jgi:hypothetical protein